ncbi:MAG: SsrA-binding protein SmpB [Candidatus Moranbacteria bacterium]|jgi:SsrA-binding protein|nr:SsrA-binding protein SmpB [Candidatus Moranbacteria bacterium]
MNKIAINRRIKFDYEILQEFEAGLALKGYEVKSIKTGHISIKNAFVTVRDSELYLTNSNIPLYKYAGNIKNYKPDAPRKILMKKKEISYLIGKKQTEGLTLAPISVYNKKGKIKLNFALARGKKKYDKREKIKERLEKRKIERKMKQSYQNRTR